MKLIKKSHAGFSDEIMQKSRNFELTRMRLDLMRQVVRSARRVLVLTHDNPDPDSIASAIALRYLMQHFFKIPAVAAYGGTIGRAENRMMVREFRIPIVNLRDIRWSDFSMLALVDHQPRAGWERWPASMPVSIVIDHHPLRKSSQKIPFADVRKGFGANSTVLVQYLFAAGLKIPKSIASCLLHGIRSDTMNFSRIKRQQDLDAYMALLPMVDHVRLERILRPVIEPSYMQGLWKGFSQAIVWRDSVVTYAGPIASPDLTSEIADRMVNIKGIKFALSCGFFEKVLYFSIRVRNSRKDAGWLIRKIIGRKGSAGGHGFMAGAQVFTGTDPVKAKLDADELLCKFARILYPSTEPGKEPKHLLTEFDSEITM